jgi:heat-inducible transcriptional repressor
MDLAKRAGMSKNGALSQRGPRSEFKLTVDLDNRSRHLLRSLIAHYIRSGEPVGSRTLARQSGLKLSPATIRNVMADLEDAGLIHSPHTSAGRVPTDQGYRMFVDTLVTLSPVEDKTYRQIETRLKEPLPASEVVNSASDLLSALTSFVGMVTVPKPERFVFKHIDFVAISDRQILVILVFQDGEVQNRIIHTRRRFDASQLERAANFLNEEYAGLLLADIRRRLIADLEQARRQMDDIMRDTIEFAGHAFSTKEGGDFVVSGQSNLLSVHEFSNIDKLRNIFDAIQHKSDILHLLEESVNADGVRIFIGEESGSEALGGCSLVTAPYALDGRVVGVLGVIGPTRMAYDRVISVVETTAQVLGSVLNQNR